MGQFYPQMRITVIGEANIDIAIVRQADTLPMGCTPGRITFHHGGVARNIAHNLCLLGHEVSLMTVFGGDDFAQSLIADGKAIGMDVSLSTVFAQEKSPIFLSFNDEKGNMQSAVSDIGLNNYMDLTWIKSKMEDINHSEIVVADTLLSAEALSYLIEHCEVPLYIDTVSPGKALRFAEAMKNAKRQKVTALKCNLAEAIALSGETEIQNAAKVVQNLGIEEVYLTLGEDGVIFCSATETMHFAPLPTQVVNVVGSGDAFFAGIIHAHALGYKGEKAIPYGLAVAKTALESAEPVNPTLCQ